MSHFSKHLVLSALFVSLIALPIILFASRTSQDIRSRASAPTTQAPIAPPVTPQCNTTRDNGSKNYTKCLKEQFNIALGGLNPKTDRQATESAEIFYKYLKIPISYPHYQKMFKSVGLKIVISPDQVGKDNVAGAWAYTATNGKTFTIFQAFFNKASASYQRYVLIHESAHVVANGSQLNGNQQENSGYYLQQNLYSSIHDANLDSDCFKNDIIGTYPQGIIDSQTFGLTERRQVHETFAESVADTILCNNSGTCSSNGTGGKSISNFPSSCRNTYNFIMQNVMNYGAPVCVNSNPPVAITPLTVNLNADGKAGSPDNPITGYQWDFDNNGRWDTDTHASKRITHTYPKAGSYSPKYRILGGHNTASPICNYSSPVSVGLSPTPTITQVFPAGPSPTPVAIDPSKTYLRLNIALSGIGKTGNPNPRKTGVDFKIVIFAPDQKKIQTITQRLNYDSSQDKYVGVVPITVPASGVYNVYISSNGYLNVSTDATIAVKSVNIIPPLSLSGGDINGDGTRNLLDWNLILSCSIFEKNKNTTICPRGSSKEQIADMDSDGTVDQDDITLWIQEFSHKVQ